MRHCLGFLWFATIVLGAVACGDDGGSPPSSTDSGMQEPDSGGFLPQRRDSGTPPPPPPGSELEGAICTGSAECGADLTCVAVEPSLSVCGRSCTSDSECGTEICFSYSRLMEDAHCVNVVRQQFGACGYDTTSVCTGRSCLFYTDTTGVCVDLCVVPNDSDAGLDDAGATGGPLPAGFVECTNGQSCIEGVVVQQMGFEGVCGRRAPRGDSCSPDSGAFCNEGDICAPEDLSDLEGPTRCYQDCTDISVVCDEGTCTDIRGVVAYCLP